MAIQTVAPGRGTARPYNAKAKLRLSRAPFNEQRSQENRSRNVCLHAFPLSQSQRPSQKKPLVLSVEPRRTEARSPIFFPARRSDRKPATFLKIEKDANQNHRIVNGIEEGLKIEMYPEKGRGVKTVREFRKGDYVVEYRGEIISRKEAQRREKDYEKNPSIGCYMYYFTCVNKQYCVDATEETKYLGRLVNHSTKEPNLRTKAVEIDGKPHLVLVAARDIAVNEELLYDYGDRNKDAIIANPWLVKT